MEQLCATGALSYPKSALQIYPQIRYLQLHLQSSAASVSASLIVPGHGSHPVTKGRIYRIQRRSPDCYAAYYHDVVINGIFVKVQIKSLINLRHNINRLVVYKNGLFRYDNKKRFSI